jgi:hypothetical protein
MAEKISTTLAEGAERLERVIRGVKERQFSEVHMAPEPKSVSTAFVVSPEEEWSKKFMTAGIGPTEFKPLEMPKIPALKPVQSLRPAPKALEPAIAAAAPSAKPAMPKPQAKAEPKPARSAAGDVRPGHIGQVLAKPARRRGWFGRLVKD